MTTVAWMTPPVRTVMTRYSHSAQRPVRAYPSTRLCPVAAA